MTKKYKVLIVEDAQIALKMASAILTDLECEVDVATTGKEAVIKAGENHYDLIFMDLGLPDMDGFSTTQAIRQIEIKEQRATRTPIIALTVHEGEHVELTCLDVSMDDFLVKPLTAEKAKQVLHKHVKKK